RQTCAPPLPTQACPPLHAPTLRAALPISEAATERTRRDAARLAREAGAVVQIHVNEHLAAVERSLLRHGARPLEHLDRVGALGPRLLAAHATRVTPAATALPRDRGAAVSYNPVATAWKGRPVLPGLSPDTPWVRFGLGTASRTAWPPATPPAGEAGPGWNGPPGTAPTPSAWAGSPERSPRGAPPTSSWSTWRSPSSPRPGTCPGNWSAPPTGTRSPRSRSAAGCGCGGAARSTGTTAPCWSAPRRRAGPPWNGPRSPGRTRSPPSTGPAAPPDERRGTGPARRDRGHRRVRPGRRRGRLRADRRPGRRADRTGAAAG